MQSRSSLAEQFSSFANIEANSFRGWLVDPRLMRSMKQHTQKTAERLETSDTLWALYWYQLWRQQSYRLAEAHLSAYLQEVAFWVARRVYQQISVSNQTSTYSVSDLFQIAIADVRPVLEKFDTIHSGNLQGFAKTALNFRLKSQLRKQHLAGFCAPWSLLRQVGQKCLVQSLTLLGLSLDVIEQRRLLVQAFKATYQVKVSGNQKLPEPNAEQLEAIASFYNSQRTSQLTQTAPRVNAQQVRTQLLETSRAIRQYLYPPIRSLNQKRYDFPEGEGIEEQDLLVASSNQSLMSEIIEAEEQSESLERQKALKHLLTKEFEQFNAQVQQILCLTYQQGLSQTEVSQRIGVAQPTVSRRLRDTKKKLVESLLELAGGVNNFSDPRQLKEVSHQLELCLVVYLAEQNHCDASDT